MEILDQEADELITKVSSPTDKIDLTACDFTAGKEKSEEFGIERIPAALRNRSDLERSFISRNN